MNSFTFGDRNQLSDEAKEGVKKLNQSYLGQILHCLEPYKIKDVRNPTADEQQHIDRAFEYTQKYFPGLDTKEKMLEYMMNVKLDLPEVMKGQRVEGVFCDVDGTLIEYAAAGSPDEGTQKLREEVVTLLKKYESEGKTITIWTGGNLEEKTTYLRSLGITRPIVSKYNYAGATAAIVIDDIGLEAFQMQSKITAETFIDAKLIK
ncbi:HAD hydrolase family protein [Patescibacteria group bacterium]|nr:HAD hydrolase family protein [Patescibacteria group bacterium]